MTDAVVQLLDDNWDSNNVPRRNLIIDKSDSIGKGRDIGTYDYIEVSITSPVDISYSDLFMSTQDIDTVVFVEIKSSSEQRRDDLFDEFRRIIESHRKRPDTPGDHDRMIFEDVTPLDDNAFGAFLHEVVIAFESRSRNVET
jgi:hypothetical protein